MTDYQNKHHKQRLNFMQRLLVRSLIYGANSWSTIETIPQSTRTIGISANYPPINNNDIIGFNRNSRYESTSCEPTNATQATDCATKFVT